MEKTRIKFLVSFVKWLHSSNGTIVESSIIRLPITSVAFCVYLWAFVYSVTVDWGEDDEEIVRLFGKRLPDETVEVTSTDKGLDVTYNGQLHSIALTFTGNDRYITIRGFQ